MTILSQDCKCTQQLYIRCLTVFLNWAALVYMYSLHTHSLINGSQSEQFHRSCNPSGKLANSLAWKPFLEPGAQTRPEQICQQSNGKWNSWRRKLSSWHRGASRDFGQVTCPTFPPSKVTSNKKEKTWCPARACGCVYVQEVCLEKRQKQMPVGSQQGCRHWPHFHPNVNTRQSVWLQNKHATCAEGISAVTALW